MGHDVKTLRNMSGMKRIIQKKAYVPIAYGSKRDLGEFLLFFFEQIISYRIIPLTHGYLNNPDATHKLYVHPANEEIVIAAKVLMKELKDSDKKPTN